MEQISFTTSSFGEWIYLAPWVVMEVLGLCSYYISVGLLAKYLFSINVMIVRMAEGTSVPNEATN